MVRNYFRIAIRNLLKSKGYAFINIAGLAAGIACCLLVTVYVFYEISYDRFHEKADRIYRIKQTSASQTKVEISATTPFKAGPALVSEYDRFIEASVRFYNMQEDATTFGNEEADISFREENFYFTEPSFFDVFSINLIQGNEKEALSNPLSVVLTEQTAKRYFGDENPMGKILEFRGVRNMTVTGILEETPRNSHMKMDLLASFSSLKSIYGEQEYDKSWFWNPCWTYILLKEDAEPQQLRDFFPSFVEKYYMSDFPEGETVELELQPVTDIHLYSDLYLEMEPNSSVFYIYLFAGMAVFILAIACINFMNLSTARSAERSREVGMRKALGADRYQLFWQFMGESLLMSFLAVLLCLVLVQIMLPAFNSFLNQQLSLELIGSNSIIWILIGLFLLVGFFSGLYPALYLSGFQPARVLKGEITRGSRGALFRKCLVVFQFAFSVILIIGTIIVYLQLQHMRTARLGFDKEQVIILSIKQNLIAWEFEKFKELALQHPAILSVTGTGQILGSNEFMYYQYSPASAAKGEESSNQTLYVTHDFIKTYGISVLAGRSFSKDFPSDPQTSILINEEMVKHLGFDTPEEALGQLFYYYPSATERESFTVAGVVGNFNSSSIKMRIAPLVIRLVEGEIPIVRDIEYAAVKVAGGGIQQALEHLEKTWNEVNFVDPFGYTFHDQELKKVYSSEIMMGKVSGAFALLCIAVACLGLFGLASYTTSLRTKEIGIRKTLGASVSSIVLLLSKEYVKLVLIANVIAWPLIFYLINQWLQNFPYRITLGWKVIGVFVLSAAISLFVCLLTVGFQSVKTALANPVESIRSE